VIRNVLNIILNKILGARRRFAKIMTAEKSSVFLPGFSASGSANPNTPRITVGKECVLAAKCIFETETGSISIGDRVYIGDSTIICKNKVTFGSDILVAWGALFYDHDSHSLDYRDRQQDIKQVHSDFINAKGQYLKNKNWTVVKSAPIEIKDNVWIGMDALILKGVTIGEGAIVAARSVVTKDVPPFTVVAGNPAKVVKNLKEE